MDKSKGFMEFSRAEPGYRPVQQRLGDFNSVEKKLSDLQIREQAARCMDCGTPFCHGYGCPLCNITPEWNDLVYRKKWKEALGLLLATSNFPEFTARVCPALCEASCVLGINAEAVSIRQIEKFIIEKGFEEGWVKPDTAIKRNGKKVAVIGAGPAGLAVADDLNKNGYAVTVYEAAKKPGGLLRYGIPDFKLEKWVIGRRINLMEEEGVVFETGVTVGADLSASFIRSRYDAACLTGGAREPRELNIPGRNLKGIYQALDYLTEQNQIVSKEISPARRKINAKNKKVVVIGGGDTGSDCIGTALRQGAKQVTQVEIMPKPPQSRSEYTPWPEWPTLLRTSSSHKEGCQRMWNVSTKEFCGKGGNVKQLACEEVQWKQGEKGKLQGFQTKPDSGFTLDADLVFLAMGFTGAKKNDVLEAFGVKRSARGNAEKNERGMTNIRGVFTAGDMASGASLVVRAIADGKKTAGQIDLYLR